MSDHDAKAKRIDGFRRILRENFPDRGALSAIAVVVLLYVVMEALGITCPILFVMGISCAGCGMSRAWLALLRLDVVAAFHYHPLFWLPPVCLFLFFLRRHFSDKVKKLLIAAVVVLMLAVYLARMLDPDDAIVVFEPQKGIVFRLLSEVGFSW